MKLDNFVKVKKAMDDMLCLGYLGALLNSGLGAQGA